MPIDNVVPDEEITADWGNSVADAINVLEPLVADLPLANLGDVADQRLVGNVSGGAAAPSALTQAQVASFLPADLVSIAVLAAGAAANYDVAAAIAAGAKWIEVEGVGGGGAGGSCAATAAGEGARGGGGGAGGWFRSVYLASALDAAEPYSVGAAGAAAAAGANNGGNGGQTYFGAVAHRVQGGGGGGGGGSASAGGTARDIALRPGGTGGTATIAGAVHTSQLMVPGQDGGGVVVISSVPVPSGGGGSTPWGAGARTLGMTVGDPGKGYGAGGDGGHRTVSSAAIAGGAGAPGRLVIRAYR